MIILMIPIIVEMMAMMKMATESFSFAPVVLAYVLYHGTAKKHGDFPLSATAERTARGNSSATNPCATGYVAASIPAAFIAPPTAPLMEEYYEPSNGSPTHAPATGSGCVAPFFV